MLGRTVCKSMVTFLSDNTPKNKKANDGFRSVQDPMKSAVVIFGIETGVRFRWGAAAADDPAGAAIMGSGGGHGVLVVVPPGLAFEPPLAVHEHDAVPRIRERAACKDQFLG